MKSNNAINNTIKDNNGTIKDNNDKLVLQILDWDFFHEEDDEEEKTFCMRLFGKTKDQQTVYLQVNNFTPYFYVELKPNWQMSTVDKIMDVVKEKVPKDVSTGLLNSVIEEKCKFWGFTNYKKIKFLKLTFNNYDSMKAYARVFAYPFKIFAISKYPIAFKLYESNILPIFRFMHIKQLEAVGWVSIDKKKLEKFFSPPTCCKLNYKTHWTNVEKVEDRLIEKFVIAAFDIECKSEDGSFPQPQRNNDKVIQIGVTLSRFGESECFYKHLLSLGQTDDIPGVDVVESCQTEEQLLLKFTTLIRKLDPDIITGYNIFGFDFEYLMERSKKLGILHKFSRLSRINNELSEWIEADLSSAALGKNILKYYKMTGRVIIDLMKVVQRDYKLTSYKLDSVASYFIREKIDKIEKCENKKNAFKIKTKNTFGLYTDQYVVITYIEGAVENKFRDGHKFRILELTNDTIVVEGSLPIDEFVGKGYKVFWCQAKDDISPNDIFKKCDGSSKDRAEIGKYCIQDCNLCNKLIAKLQIVTNNVSMANVCNVPLTYLFLRGQGVKIFSLVSKKCREKNHVIPVIKKKVKPADENNKFKNNDKGNDKYNNNDKNNEDEIHDSKLEKFINNINTKNNNQEEDDEDEVGYEGAIVFIPDAGVYYEPIPVLDYASLYPNGMILRNLSHECFVDDPEYDNIPGYKYHVITYNNNDGTTTTCRFAEKLDGTKGIIPEILMDLLSARKKYKKEMEAEKDPFKRSILDSLQLAYKITANSLYGQTGASTSPICMKEIAASTTATGREMLLFSKYFIENYFAKMINLALCDKNKFMAYANEIYKYYPTEFVVDDVTVDEKTKKKSKFTHNIHVCTDKNLEIHSSKFVGKDIGYELECELYNDFKNVSKFYDKYKKQMIVFGYDTPQSFNDKFVKSLKNASVNDRMDFYDDLYEIVIYNKKTKKAFWKNHRTLLENMGFDNETYVDLFELSKVDNDEEFLGILKDNISNMGYNNKTELFESFYNMINDTLTGYDLKPEIIYGDTDSVFFRMNLVDQKTGKKNKTQKELIACIKTGIWASIMICTMLPSPMSQCYEKVLYPFVIQGKKRYVGNLYEKNPNDFYQKSMGIELKRRDNAPIVKNVCSGIIDQILNKHSSIGAYEFVKETMQKIITGKYKMDKFIITKTLKGNALSKEERLLEKAKPKEQRSYANRESIVHAVLADRMADRDYGNRPLSNDRIPYMYIETKKEVQLQGERVETPEYIIENKLKIDYLFYITNQIMKPSLKFLDLIIHNAENVFNEYIVKEENRKKCMMPIAFYANDNDKEDGLDELLDNDIMMQPTKSKTMKVKMPKQKIIKNKPPKKLVTNKDINALFD